MITALVNLTWLFLALISERSCLKVTLLFISMKNLGFNLIKIFGALFYAILTIVAAVIKVFIPARLKLMEFNIFIQLDGCTFATLTRNINITSIFVSHT